MSRLVAGGVRPSGGDTVVLTGASPDCEPPLRQLRGIVRLLRHALGANADVDVEWVWDGDQVHVVQFRKVTASLPAAVILTEPADGPVLRVAQICGDGADVVGLDLGDVTDVYWSYRRKRLALVEVAVRHGCGAGAAIVLRYNRAGLATALWSKLLAALGERWWWMSASMPDRSSCRSTS